MSQLRARIVITAIIIAGTFASSVHAGQPGLSITAAGQSTVPVTEQSPAAPEQVSVEAASTDASLTQAPAKAIVADATTPGWATVYGTQAGADQFAPRIPDIPAVVSGATPPLSGTWRTATVTAGTNGITAIAYTPDGRLFAGISNVGLRAYAPDVNGIYQWNSVAGAPGNVTALAVFNNGLWVGTAAQGLHVYTLSTGAWTTYTVAPLPSNTINRLTPVNNPRGADYLWISTPNGAVKHIPAGRGGLATWTLINTVDGLPSNYIYDVAVDYSSSVTGTTYFATDLGLESFNGTTYAPENGTCTYNYVTRIIVDRFGRLWMTPIELIAALLAPKSPSASVPVPQGVCMRYTGIFGLTFWQHFDVTTPGLPTANVSDLSEDFTGRIWMSMRGAGGAAVYDQGTWSIYTSPTRPLLNNDVEHVLAVGEDVWFGHNSASAFSLYSPNWLRTPATVLGDQPGPVYLDPTRTWAGLGARIGYTDGSAWVTTTLPGNTSAVQALIRDGGDDLWIGTAASGVYTYNTGISAFNQFTVSSGLPGNNVAALLKDHQNRMWAGTSTGLAMRTEAGYWITFTTGTAPLQSNTITALAEDSAQRLWIGSPTNGITILDLNGVGSAAWLSQTTATGVPSNTITAIAAGPTGDMWVGTASGLGLWSVVSATWTIYNTTNSQLPDNAITQIAVDGLGRTWVATRGGVAVVEGKVLKPFYVPGTMVESDHITGLAADGARTWVSTIGSPTSNSSIAVRGVITKPIGSTPPAISTITPIAAVPGATILVNGSHYDDRGPEFNAVLFSDAKGYPVIPANILSVTANSIAVVVPPTAASGPLQVQANGLRSPLSVQSFQLKPQITSLSSTCVSPGDELEVNGVGFLDGYAAAYIKIGNSAERLADATDPKMIRTTILPTDAGGKVQVRLLNNNTALSAKTVNTTSLTFDNVYVQQGIEDERMIYGKRTLVQIAMHSVGCGTASMTGALAYWKFSGGAIIPAGYLNYTTTRSIATNTPQVINMVNTVSIIAQLDLSDVLYKLNLGPGTSSLSYFNGMSVTLQNKLVKVMSIQIPKSKFNFIDTSQSLRHLTTMMVTSNNPNKQDATFQSTMMSNMAAAARIYPQQDAWWYGGPYGWLHDTPIWLSTPDLIDISTSGNYGDVRGKVEDYLDPGGQYWAVALIDQNIVTGTAAGISASGWRTIVAENGTNTGGRYMIHEFMHAQGFVDSSSANYQYSSKPGADNHSKYDEGQWPTNPQDFSLCISTKAYKQALVDSTGANKRTVRLADGNSGDLRTAACASSAKNDQSNTAKSIISYSPKRNNFNVILEPIDYRTLIAQICTGSNDLSQNADSTCAGYANYAPALLNAPTRALLGPAIVPTRTLRLSGQIDISGMVTPSLSYIEVNEGDVTPQDMDGDYHLRVLDISGMVVHDQHFSLDSGGLTPHDTTVSAPDSRSSVAHTPGLTATTSLFTLRVPFPTGAMTAEIKHDGNVLWSKGVSPNTPTVTLLTPVGGTIYATATTTVTWSASDLDTDALQFGIDYSPDGGVTWDLVTPKVTGTSFNWVPNFLPGSNNARLRVRASDGFNVGTSVSAPFILVPHGPAAAILAPVDGQVYTEGAIFTLEGSSVTSHGIGAGAFKWKQGAQTLGLTRSVPVSLSAVGMQIYTLEVTDNGMTATKSVTITVLPDYDHDGLPNAWESQNAFNPLDPTDATGDADGDGLSNQDEYALGTNPHSADTDGDSYTDSAELAAGTDPLDAASFPASTPLLNVGSSSMGFVVDWNAPVLPSPKSTWVTNDGSGVLNWSAATDAPWLTVSPTSSIAPQELTVGYSLAGIAPGVYEGHINVTSPGVTGSPQMITVTLTVNGAPNHVYLPMLSR